MNNPLTLTINGTPIEAPSGIPTNGADAGKIVGWGIALLLITATLLALAFFMYGGFMWMTSRGDKEKLSTARKAIYWAGIGLLICFLSFAVIGVIGVMFGTNLLEGGL